MLRTVIALCVPKEVPCISVTQIFKTAEGCLTGARMTKCTFCFSPFCAEYKVTDAGFALGWSPAFLLGPTQSLIQGDIAAWNHSLLLSERNHLFSSVTRRQYEYSTGPLFANHHFSSFIFTFLVLHNCNKYYQSIWLLFEKSVNIWNTSILGDRNELHSLEFISQTNWQMWKTMYLWK